MVIPPTIEVANLGMADSLILMVLALVVFGPRRLPQIGRQIGKLMYEFRKASNDFKFQMEEELRNAEEADRRKKEEDERQRQLAAAPPAQLEAGESASTETPASTESSYSYGETYGEIAEAQEKAEATYPIIRPPSTGETVPSGLPAIDDAAGQETSAPANAEASRSETPEAATQAYAVPPSVEQETPVERENEVKEPALEDTNSAKEPAATNG
jgi:sec-independent protein translocase protein TatB